MEKETQISIYSAIVRPYLITPVKYGMCLRKPSFIVLCITEQNFGILYQNTLEKVDQFLPFEI